jgi:hypothetical protein
MKIGSDDVEGAAGVPRTTATWGPHLLVGCALIAGVGTLIGFLVPQARTPTASASIATEMPPAPALTMKPAEPTVPELAARASTLAEAVRIALPYMTDEPNKTSPGTGLVAIWAAKHLKLADVNVKKDETTYALTRKDPDEARGKRLCATGELIEIQVAKTEFGKLAEGLLTTNGGSLFHFTTVGSSGELVGGSHGRVCGVVTGVFDYSNSGGGVGHAVQLVGMFDIAENGGRKPVVDNDDY